VVESSDLEGATVTAALTRGLGRSYGDASLPAEADDIVVQSPTADRILACDPETGVLRAEAGLSLREINRLFLARGWFSPVSPGTQFVTLGGMVAADVHGKNHHVAGTFGRHVRSLLLRVADGRIVNCSAEVERDLFLATIGGMGLTGHILEVECALERAETPWIWGESRRCSSLDEVVEGLRSSRDWPYTVAWLDTLAGGRSFGRGILMRGRWAHADEAASAPPEPRRALAVPVEAPSWVLSGGSIRVFNALYYRRPMQPAGGTVHPEAFFYPLDAIERSNLLYGRRGFTQYQCVVPHGTDHAPARSVLELARSRGVASFLTVLKDFGEQGPGLLSFPMKGLTLTLDLPLRSDTAETVSALNGLVTDLGGRIYLAKDALTTADEFSRMEPRLPAWQEVRRRWDPNLRVRSALSRRLLDGHS
jgi:FAD/FMN-containing dehydrogenase